MGKINAGLKSMNAGLGERPWCNGSSYTVADIAVGCTLEYLDFRFPEISWRNDYSNLVRLHEKLAARPSFIDTRIPQ
jgi:glutathione S-transferase